MKNKLIDFFKKITVTKQFQSIKTFAKMHKVWFAIIVIGILITGYFSYSKLFTNASTVQYTFGRVTRGDLVVSVSGSGQVATLSKVSIKPNTTGQTQTLGQIISVRVKNGDTVKAGQVVAILDGKNALQTLNQAKASFISAQANYNKVLSGLTESELISLNNSIKSAQTSLNNSKQNIILSLKSAYTTISNTVYLNTDSYFDNPLSSPLLIITGVDFISQQLQNNVNQGRNDVGFLLSVWREKVKTQSTLEAATTSNEYIINTINSAVVDLNTIRNYFDDMTTLFALYSLSSDSAGASTLSSAKSAASSARGSADTLISSLTSSLQSYNNLITSLDQANENLRLQQEPPAEADLASAQSSLDNAKANLTNAETAYSSRIITAPFDGQIGGLAADVGQQVSSSDSLGTLITSEKVINVILNEVDAAKITAGNLVTITFDSLPGISLTGHVSYIDPLGTVTQGVVSYSAQIKMDEQNDQVKTAMTASVAIVTTQHTGSLIIPTSAITTTGGKKYVLVADIASSTLQKSGFGGNFNTSSTTRDISPTSRRNFASSTFSTSTRASSTRQFGNNIASNTSITSLASTQYPVVQIEITTGISNNTSTEILSGLFEGQMIVTKKSTVTSTAAKTSASAATTNTRGGFGGSFGGGTAGASGGMMQVRGN